MENFCVDIDFFISDKTYIKQTGEIFQISKWFTSSFLFMHFLVCLYITNNLMFCEVQKYIKMQQNCSKWQSFEEQSLS